MENLLKALAGEPKGVITIYGEAATGKTTLCLAEAAEITKKGKKVIYIDPQNNFSIERFRQVGNSGSQENDSELLSKVMVAKPKDFEEQEALLNRLRKTPNRDIGLLVLDPISTFYRLEFGKKEKESYMINRNLGIQLSFLNDIARNFGIPVLVTAQTQAEPGQGQEAAMVGGNVIDYMSNIVIELKKYHGKKRLAVVKKPKSIARKQIIFEIDQAGITIA